MLSAGRDSPAATIGFGMETRARSPLRFLAPVALGVAAVIFIIVVYSSIGGGSQPTDTDTASQSAPRGDGGGGGGGGGNGGQGGGQDSYEVKEGDTLDGIAEETGVPVEEILELNPTLDPQSIGAGQEIQLRE